MYSTCINVSNLLYFKQECIFLPYKINHLFFIGQSQSQCGSGDVWGRTCHCVLLWPPCAEVCVLHCVFERTLHISVSLSVHAGSRPRPGVCRLLFPSEGDNSFERMTYCIVYLRRHPQLVCILSSLLALCAPWWRSRLVLPLDTARLSGWISHTFAHVEQLHFEPISGKWERLVVSSEFLLISQMSELRSVELRVSCWRQPTSKVRTVTPGLGFLFRIQHFWSVNFINNT